MTIESSNDERLVEIVAWVNGTVCIHCGERPKGHKWILDDMDEVIGMLCPNGTRTPQGGSEGLRALVDDLRTQREQEGA